MNHGHHGSSHVHSQHERNQAIGRPYPLIPHVLPQPSLPLYLPGPPPPPPQAYMGPSYNPYQLHRSESTSNSEPPFLTRSDSNASSSRSRETGHDYEGHHSFYPPATSAYKLAEEEETNESRNAAFDFNDLVLASSSVAGPIYPLPPLPTPSRSIVPSNSREITAFPSAGGSGENAMDWPSVLPNPTLPPISIGPSQEQYGYYAAPLYAGAYHQPQQQQQYILPAASDYSYQAHPPTPPSSIHFEEHDEFVGSTTAEMLNPLDTGETLDDLLSVLASLEEAGIVREDLEDSNMEVEINPGLREEKWRSLSVATNFSSEHSRDLSQYARSNPSPLGVSSLPPTTTASTSSISIPNPPDTLFLPTNSALSLSPTNDENFGFGGEIDETGGTGDMFDIDRWRTDLLQWEETGASSEDEWDGMDLRSNVASGASVTGSEVGGLGSYPSATTTPFRPDLAFRSNTRFSNESTTSLSEISFSGTEGGREGGSSEYNGIGAGKGETLSSFYQEFELSLSDHQGSLRSDSVRSLSNERPSRWDVAGEELLLESEVEEEEFDFGIPVTTPMDGGNERDDEGEDGEEEDEEREGGDPVTPHAATHFNEDEDLNDREEQDQEEEEEDMRGEYEVIQDLEEVEEEDEEEDEVGTREEERETSPGEWM